MPLEEASFILVVWVMFESIISMESNVFYYSDEKSGFMHSHDMFNISFCVYVFFSNVSFLKMYEFN